MKLTDEHRSMLRQLWRHGAQSRSDLHGLMGVVPNRVGAAAAAMVQAGLLRECEAQPSGGGRPRVPLEIDPEQRHMVGLTIWPGMVGVARVNLRGGLVGKPVARMVSEDSDRLVEAAAGLLAKTINEKTMGVGVSIPGFIDPGSGRILSGVFVSAHDSLSLAPVIQRAGGLPVVIENDMHALAARWSLTHRAPAEQDVLLVNIADGALGAAVLIGGQPNRGCVSSANELGHMRYFVETDTCYCGQVGCLERVFSSEYLSRLDGADGVEAGALMVRLSRYRPGDEAVDVLLDYLSNGIANVANFIRPHRLVLVSELTRYPEASDVLTASIRRRLLGELVGRVRVDLWEQPVAHLAETAGWLALAGLYCEGWV